MNINDQKELLEGILNHSKYTEGKDRDFNLKDIMTSLNAQLGVSTPMETNDESPFVLEDGSIDIDTMTQYCQQIGMEPIDLVNYVFNQLTQMKNFSHMGQSIDLSKANEILDYTKRQFEEYKKSEDINNF